jgi:hypothetical protein
VVADQDHVLDVLVQCRHHVGFQYLRRWKNYQSLYDGMLFTVSITRTSRCPRRWKKIPKVYSVVVAPTDVY